MAAVRDATRQWRDNPLTYAVDTVLVGKGSHSLTGCCDKIKFHTIASVTRDYDQPNTAVVKQLTFPYSDWVRWAEVFHFHMFAFVNFRGIGGYKLNPSRCGHIYTAT
jgi:hypothetical protein